MFNRQKQEVPEKKMEIVLKVLVTGVVLWLTLNGKILQCEVFDLRPNSLDVLFDYQSAHRSENVLKQSTNNQLILHKTNYLQTNFVDSKSSENVWYNTATVSKIICSNRTTFSILRCGAAKNVNYSQTYHEIHKKRTCGLQHTKTFELSVLTASKTSDIQNLVDTIQRIIKSLHFEAASASFHTILKFFHPIFNFTKFFFENISINVFPEKYKTPMTMTPVSQSSYITFQEIFTSTCNSHFETNTLTEESPLLCSENTAAMVYENVTELFTTENPCAQTISNIYLVSSTAKITLLPNNVKSLGNPQNYSFTSGYYSAPVELIGSISSSMSFPFISNDVDSVTATPTLFLSDSFYISSSCTHSVKGETNFKGTSNEKVCCSDSSSSEDEYVSSSNSETSCESSSSGEAIYIGRSSSGEAAYIGSGSSGEAVCIGSSSSREDNSIRVCNGGASCEENSEDSYESYRPSETSIMCSFS